MKKAIFKNHYSVDKFVATGDVPDEACRPGHAVMFVGGPWLFKDFDEEGRAVFIGVAGIHDPINIDEYERDESGILMVSDSKAYRA